MRAAWWSGWRRHGQRRAIVTVIVWAVGMSAAVGAAAEAEPSAASSYQTVQAAFLQEEFGRVTELAQPVLAVAPMDADAVQIWLWHALSLERLQRSHEALAVLDRLQQQLTRPSDQPPLPWRDRYLPETLFWKGEMNRRALKPIPARHAYQRIIEEFPESPWRAKAHRGLGLVLMQQQAYRQARDHLREAAQRSPTQTGVAELRLLEGLCELQLQHFTEAAAILRVVVAQSPLDDALRVQALFALGEAFTGLRQFEQATQAYQHVRELAAGSPWASLASFGIGWAAFQQGRCAESLAAFADDAHTAQTPLRTDEWALQPPVTVVERLFAEGGCLMDLGRIDEAYHRFETVRRLDPEHALAIDAALRMADILRHQRRDAQAAAVLESVVYQAFDPVQVAHANLALGQLALDAADAPGARAYWLEVISIPDQELRQAARNGLGDAAQQLEELEEAAQWYRDSIHIAAATPHGLYATYQLGRLKAQAGASAEATEIFRRLLAHADGSLQAEARLALAAVYISQAQHDLARVELEHVRTQHPASPYAGRASYYLALIAASNSDAAQVVSLCREAIDHAPDSEEALEARLLQADVMAQFLSPDEAQAALQAALHGTDGAAATLPAAHRGRIAWKLAELASHRHAYADAIRGYEQAWELLPSARGELTYRIASCYEQAGDLQQALHRYRQIEQTPWATRGQLAAAKLMERDGQWQDARQIYERMTQQEIPEAKIAQERLALLGQTRNGSSSFP